MKKIILYSLLLSLFSVSFVSCSDKDEVEQYPQHVGLLSSSYPFVFTEGDIFNTPIGIQSVSDTVAMLDLKLNASAKQETQVTFAIAEGQEGEKCLNNFLDTYNKYFEFEEGRLVDAPKNAFTISEEQVTFKVGENKKQIAVVIKDKDAFASLTKDRLYIPVKVESISNGEISRKYGVINVIIYVSKKVFLPWKETNLKSFNKVAYDSYVLSPDNSFESMGSDFPSANANDGQINTPWGIVWKDNPENRKFQADFKNPLELMGLRIGMATDYTFRYINPTRASLWYQTETDEWVEYGDYDIKYDSYNIGAGDTDADGYLNIQFFAPIKVKALKIIPAKTTNWWGEENTMSGIGELEFYTK